MPVGAASALRKFADPDVTADGADRARVAMDRLDTVWVNTGTLCNIECAHCYIESSPANDRLVYLPRDELAPFLTEAKKLGAREIGFTGGEPFMNPDMPAMTQDCLDAGFNVLILTNAMRPMMRPLVQAALTALKPSKETSLTMRVSLDHYTAARHDAERGAGGFAESMKGLQWLAAEGFDVAVAGRRLWSESEEAARDGYAQLFTAHQLPIDAEDPARVVLFPELDETVDTPEITSACWDILGKSPASVMCSSSRMIVKRRGADAPVVVACTLIPYDEAFEMGGDLSGALEPVKLNHPHCSKFCVLGGASCSA